MSSDIGLDEFGTEPGGIGSGTARVADVLARGVPLRWDEAVALLQEILDRLTTGRGTNAVLPAFDDILIDGKGAVTILTTRRGERGPVAGGRALHALLATADVPVPLRLFVTQANAPETHPSLAAFAEALAYFGKPNRGDLIRAIYDRYRSTASATTPASTKTGRPDAPPPLTQNAARREHTGERPRTTPPPWLGPVAAVLCLASLVAVIWSGLLGESTDKAGSAPAEAKADDADAPSSATREQKPASKGTPAGRARASTAQPRAPATERAAGVAAARKDSAPVIERSAVRPGEPPLRAVPEPETPVAQTAEPSVVIPISREYVVAPRESTAGTIYSSVDADVQPPVLIYPSLPPPIFVAGNAESVVVNRMELVVAADGSVERVRLVSGPTRMPDMMLLSGAKLWKFTPAVKNGAPVRYRAIVTWTAFP